MAHQFAVYLQFDEISAALLLFNDGPRWQSGLLLPQKVVGLIPSYTGVLC